MIGVYDVTAVNEGRAKGAAAGGDPVPAHAVPGFQFRAVATPGQADVQGSRTDPDIVEVEVEYVVAFDNIGIAASNTLVEGFEECAFGHLPGAEYLLVAPVVGKRDQDNARVTSFGVEAGGLDIQLHPVGLVVTQAPKERVS